MRRAAPLLALLSLAGCGGHGGGSSSGPSASTTSVGKGPGRAVLTVKWPVQSGARLIPNAANSVVVKLTLGTTVVSKTFPRPAAGGTTTSTTLTGLAYGTYAVVVGGFPGTDGSGVAQAGGSGTMTVTEDAPGKVTVALDSTVKSLVLPPASVVGSGGPGAITVSAKDAEGNVVLLAAGGRSETLEWSVADPGVATIAGTGPTASVTGVALGTTSVTARLKVKDDGTTVETTAPLACVAQTLDLSATNAVDYGTYLPTWTGQTIYSALPHFTVQATLSPTRPTATAVALAVSGPLTGYLINTPSSIAIPANAASGAVALQPTHVDVDTPATLTATLDGITKVATVTVRANSLYSATGPATLASGASGTGTVTLGLYALARETVNLTCDDPTVTLPASVTVPGPSRLGSPQNPNPNYIAFKTASFTLTAPTVTASRTVTITATRAGVSKSFVVTITP